jgi:putative phosphoesterase
VELAIISDTHLPKGARTLPAACISRLASADLILHAGDLVGIEVLREIEALGPPLAAVHGNVDTAEVRAVLPERRVVEAGGARIGMVHDAGPAQGRLARLQKQFPDTDAVVFGHSHMPLLERNEHGFQIFNSGSPTDRRREPRHTMGLARVRARKLTFEHVALD